ncbi:MULTISPECIES: protein translocase subunit SecD [Curtobacterium]|uniref:protein translocase subunit SecD n=1 Tax=Curtobacterium TaxID=2034 RepID=UPI000DA9463B|nr:MULTISPECIES: protein translocase subunit SecD [Curtobacterium]MBY0175825.1 protein translocase subunit SecD [Curtobacterium herbarum]MCP1501989.1 preprotein translocase subunit SecD [Curtobacterium herbarum]MDN4647324.1 protein translocase subunit SecD [Curtobacterium sp. PsM8]WIE59889.1 protein translocase subunit SecD [Curtobacterium sp. MCLR17_032]
MARSTPVKKALRSLTWLVILIAVLAGLNTAASVLAGSTKDASDKWYAGASWVPELALDLQGGTQITLAAQSTEGSAVTSQQLQQAVNIIRQRIDATGVSESEINTQGANNIVVSIPGKPDQQTIQRIEAAAKLTFRPVLFTEAASDSAVGDSGKGSTASPTPYSPPASLQATPSSKPTNGSDLAWVTPKLQDLYTNYKCSAPDDVTSAPDDEPLVTCDNDGAAKYILGPVEVSGADISNATSGLASNSQGTTTGEWAVNLSFNGAGTKDFGSVTNRLVKLTQPQNQFAIVLDGTVITAPTTNSAITNGKAQITGNFTADSSKTLADQLKYGALPINFQVQSNEVISSTLGTAQLVGGLVAGLIGLILVVIYSVIQYRSLAFVTVLSLGVAAALTYLVIAIMSWRVDYRLSLAGVAGLIVAIGITADSFIVYFERIRDELRDGRALESAVESGWKRALRTILASDSVNFLAAVTLYVLAVSDVKGFAFTLLLTTLIDVVVVALFTHPMMQLIARTRFFGEGHRFSGLDPAALGAVYRGRAQFRAPIVDGKRQRSAREAARRQTIAERKAAGSDNGTGNGTGNGKDS